MTSINQFLASLNFLSIMSFVLLLVAVGYGSVAGWRWVVDGDLRSKGIKVEGRVFSKQKEEHQQSRRYGSYYYLYFVTFVYDCNGVPYEHTQNVSERHYGRFSKGQTVAVSFMPDNPNVAELVGVDADSSRITRPATVATGVFLLVIMFQVLNVFHIFKK